MFSSAKSPARPLRRSLARLRRTLLVTLVAALALATPSLAARSTIVSSRPPLAHAFVAALLCCEPPPSNERWVLPEGHGTGRGATPDVSVDGSGGGGDVLMYVAGGAVLLLGLVYFAQAEKR